VFMTIKFKKGQAVRFQWNDDGVVRESKGKFVWHDPMLGWSSCSFDKTNVEVKVLPWAIRPIIRRKKK